MYALVEIGGKQYKVKENMQLLVDRLNAQEGQSIAFDKVLMIMDEHNGAKIGFPALERASVQARVLEHLRSKKLVVFKYKPKKNYKRKRGHRQQFTKIIITSITDDSDTSQA